MMTLMKIHLTTRDQSEDDDRPMILATTHHDALAEPRPQWPSSRDVNQVDTGRGMMRI